MDTYGLPDCGCFDVDLLRTNDFLEDADDDDLSIDERLEEPAEFLLADESDIAWHSDDQNVATVTAQCSTRRCLFRTTVGRCGLYKGSQSKHVLDDSNRNCTNITLDK